MNRSEVSFWLAVALVAVVAVGLFKVVGNQPWVPDVVKRFANSL